MISDMTMSQAQFETEKAKKKIKIPKNFHSTQLLFLTGSQVWI